jgi:GT2 family glycosyltransferase
MQPELPVIGIGITTYKRPDYFKDCIESVEKHLLPHVDFVFVYNDGSDKASYTPIYDKIDKRVHIEHKNKNRGVAHAKNWLLRRMVKEGCDYIFLLEDDLIIKSPKAVFEYIKVSKDTGIGHLMFAHHGPMNKDRLIHSDPNGIELYPHCVGAWTFYTREALENVGYMDENFINAYEHVEHSHRMSIAGYTEEWPYFADVRGSADWITEQPEAIENSSISKSKKWALNSIKALYYWRSKDPRNFPLQEAINVLEDKYKYGD